MAKTYYVRQSPNEAAATHLDAAGNPAILRAYPFPKAPSGTDFSGSESEAEAHFGLTKIVRPPVVPQEITPRQMRLELLSRGISEADVLQLIDGNSDPVAREVARIEWEYSTSVNRTHPLIDGLAAALGLSSGDVDALFIAAKAR